MLPKGSRFTYKDYLALPEDGKRYEIIEGELFNAPAPFVRHQIISRELEFILINYIKKKNLGEIFHAPTDVVLSNIDVVQPDILFISKENLNIVTERNIKGIPDLMIEIISGRKSRMEKVTKKRLYHRYKVKNYWIVDSKKDILEVYEWEKENYKLKGKYGKNDTLEVPLFSGLKINLREIFL